MSKRTLLIVVLVIAAFAIVVGGMLWPRPQFERGPWAIPGGEAPADSAAAEP